MWAGRRPSTCPEFSGPEKERGDSGSERQLKGTKQNAQGTQFPRRRTQSLQSSGPISTTVNMGDKETVLEGN